MALTRDKRIWGVLYRYCAICDSHYIAGSYRELHKPGPRHQAALKQRYYDMVWLKRNGSNAIREKHDNS